VFNIDQLLRTRRSIRDYSDTVPDDSKVKEIVASALHYPSPSGSHTVRFVRIKSPSITEKLKKEMEQKRDDLMEAASSLEKPKRIKNYIKAYWRYTEFMFGSPVLMAVSQKFPDSTFSGTLSKAGLLKENYDEIRNFNIGLGASLMAFQLKTHCEGLGSCILTAPLSFIGKDRLMDILGFEPNCFLTMGYPQSDEELQERHYDIKKYYREI